MEAHAREQNKYEAAMSEHQAQRERQEAWMEGAREGAAKIAEWSCVLPAAAAGHGSSSSRTTAGKQIIGKAGKQVKTSKQVMAKAGKQIKAKWQRLSTECVDLNGNAN